MTKTPGRIVKKLRNHLCLIIGLFSFSNAFAVSAISDSIIIPKDTIGIDSYTTSIFEKLYQEDEMISVIIQTDLKQVLANRKTNEYTSAKFWYMDQSGRSIKNKVKLRARGKTRRKICDFPPLQVKFKKSKLRKDSLAPFNQLKLVTHCFDDPSFESNLFKEYLSYRLLNHLTDQSFKVQLLKITYIDSKDKDNRMERYGMFIETADELAHRLEGKIIDDYYACPVVRLNQENYMRVSAFQYMIGNTDWELRFLHNVKLIGMRDSSKLILVPYDFDYSGVVNATYAKPNPNISQKKVRDRVFQGNHNDNEGMRRVLEKMLLKKELCKDYCDSFKYLSKKERKDIRKYLNEFFKMAENRKKMEEVFYTKQIESPDETK